MDYTTKLPIGIDDFTLLREDGFLYVDKTAQLEKLVRNGQRYFLSRPQGFGKSLTMSVLSAMFSGKTAFFSGLSSEKWVQTCAANPYPVISLDFSALHSENPESFEKSLQKRIQFSARSFSCTIAGATVQDTVIELLDAVYLSKGTVVLLIDNYDAPILRSIRNVELVLAIYNILKSFYDALNTCNKYIKFLMITGVEKYNKTGVFSTMQNIRDISNDKEYGDLFGFTQIEFEKNFTYWLDRNARNVHVSREAYAKEAGNRMSCFDGTTKVYNPNAIMQSLLDCDLNTYITYINKEQITYINKGQKNTVYPFTCINQGDSLFLEARNSKTYVDKSELIMYTNECLESNKKYICISRPRRFGKTISANMVTAYYDTVCDANIVFTDLKIAKHSSFSTFANKYIVIKVTIQNYLGATHNIDLLIKKLQSDIRNELLLQYGNEHPSDDINTLMESVTLFTGKKFVIVVDEWDCILRENSTNDDWQKKYLDFLRYWFKDQQHIALVYMTGILPIKKYGTHSALNMFNEYTMLNAGSFTEFVGFTEEEVKDLCRKYNRDFNECKRWYDGYQIGEYTAIYNPTSVDMYISSGYLGTYWNTTETYEALRIYIAREDISLHDSIVQLLANESVPIDPRSFVNDMKTFESQDDILTLLVHLGYLTYNEKDSSVHIPNKEISGEFVTAIKKGGWPVVVDAIKNSENLLSAVFCGDSDAVAKGIEDVHMKEVSIFKYNDENALACIISLAFYAAREKYTIIREFPSGKGFADLVFLPRPGCLDPALVIELKWNKSASTAIDQIHERMYPASLKDHTGKLILVGINYDKEHKKHTCQIECM